MIVIHGPSTSPTGIGYSISYMAKAIYDLGYQVACGPAEDLWAQPGYHLVMNQPMELDPNMPWHGFMPAFEFPPRKDEWPKLKLKGPKSRLFAMNPFIAQELQRYNHPHQDQVRLVQLGAPEGRVAMLPRQTNTICTVGKAEPRKGTAALLDALNTVCTMVPTNEPQIFLGIAHPLHQPEELERIREYCDRGGYQLLPFVEHHDQVRALFDTCHVAVFPSCAEGWNMGLTEAVAQGCVVVASDIPAHRYQHGKLAEALGLEEADRRLRLVPTHEAPMRGHPRWYPQHLYPNVRWHECKPEDLANAIHEALCSPMLEPLPVGQFPLSWERAAKVLINEISEVYDPPRR